jgi:hypothetical protein
MVGSGDVVRRKSEDALLDDRSTQLKVGRAQCYQLAEAQWDRTPDENASGLSPRALQVIKGWLAVERAPTRSVGLRAPS